MAGENQYLDEAVANLLAYHDFTQIDDKLWLGGATVMCAAGHSFAAVHNIRLVINCAIEVEYRNEATPVLNIPFQDVRSQILWPDIHIASQAIEAAHSLGHNVYVHCAAGISRSPSIIIYHLMRIKKINFDEAYKIVSSKRNIINPNEGFTAQLKALDKYLNTKNDFAPASRPIPNMFDYDLRE